MSLTLTNVFNFGDRFARIIKHDHALEMWIYDALDDLKEGQFSAYMIWPGVDQFTVDFQKLLSHCKR